MTCSGSVSWCGFAQAIFARAKALLNGKTPEVHPILSSDYPTLARRPKNSVLSNGKLNSRFGVRLDSWETALDEVIRKLKMSQEKA
jgi:dTDP-4-dehydrorhamnose reductase